MSTPAPYLANANTTDLGQRGRAEMQALGAIQVAAFHQLRAAAKAAFYEKPEGKALAEEHKTGGDAKALRDRVERATALAAEEPLFRLERFLQRFVAEENWRRGIIAVEEKREQFEPFVKPFEGEAKGSLELDPDIDMPRFFSEVEFHLQPGGWEGYDLYGPVLSYAIYPHVFARGGFAAMPATPAAIGYRSRIIQMLPRRDYQKVYEVGCGSGSTTRWLRQILPEAEITGSDLSAVQVKSGFAVSEKAGAAIHFKQRDARNTREPSDAFDLVVSNAVSHEMPPKANLEMYREIFRILKPGGDLLMMDPPPFRDVDPFYGAILNWETDHRDEPFFTSALRTNWVDELTKIGFHVKTAEVLDGEFPWVLIASKPETAQ